MANHAKKSKLGYFVACVMVLNALIIAACLALAFRIGEFPSAGFFTYAGIVLGVEQLASAWIKVEKNKAGDSGQNS